MAKKQNKKENKPLLNIDGAEYSVDELNDNQKLMVQHLSDLNRKIDSTTFNLQQLQFGRQAFVDALKASIDEESVVEDSEQQLRKFQVIDSKVFNLYAEYGAVGIIVVLFAMMIINLIKSQKLQNEDLDKIRQSIAKAETKMANVESVVLKMLDRWNRSDEISQRHREDIVKELNDVTDDLAYLKGRINSK